MSGYHMNRDDRPPSPPKLVELLPPRPTSERSVRIREIKEVVGKKFNVSVRDLEGQGRHQGHSRPRHIAFWICKNATKHSLPKIGREFGGRDHTSVVHGVHNINAQLAVDAELWDDIKDILAELDQLATPNSEAADEGQG